jgi:hypothetical protein
MTAVQRGKLVYEGHTLGRARLFRWSGSPLRLNQRQARKVSSKVTSRQDVHPLLHRWNLRRAAPRHPFDQEPSAECIQVAVYGEEAAIGMALNKP